MRLSGRDGHMRGVTDSDGRDLLCVVAMEMYVPVRDGHLRAW